MKGKNTVTYYILYGVQSPSVSLVKIKDPSVTWEAYAVGWSVRLDISGMWKEAILACKLYTVLWEAA